MNSEDIKTYLRQEFYKYIIEKNLKDINLPIFDSFNIWIDEDDYLSLIDALYTSSDKTFNSWAKFLLKHISVLSVNTKELFNKHPQTLFDADVESKNKWIIENANMLEPKKDNYLFHAISWLQEREESFLKKSENIEQLKDSQEQEVADANVQEEFEAFTYVEKIIQLLSFNRVVTDNEVTTKLYNYFKKSFKDSLEELKESYAHIEPSTLINILKVLVNKSKALKSEVKETFETLNKKIDRGEKLNQEDAKILENVLEKKGLLNQDIKSHIDNLKETIKYNEDQPPEDLLLTKKKDLREGIQLLLIKRIPKIIKIIYLNDIKFAAEVDKIAQTKNNLKSSRTLDQAMQAYTKAVDTIGQSIEYNKILIMLLFYAPHLSEFPADFFKSKNDPALQKKLNNLKKLIKLYNPTELIAADESNTPSWGKEVEGRFASYAKNIQLLDELQSYLETEVSNLSTTKSKGPDINLQQIKLGAEEIKEEETKEEKEVVPKPFKVYENENEIPFSRSEEGKKYKNQEKQKIEAPKSSVVFFEGKSTKYAKSLSKNTKHKIEGLKNKIVLLDDQIMSVKVKLKSNEEKYKYYSEFDKANTTHEALKRSLGQGEYMKKKHGGQIRVVEGAKNFHGSHLKKGPLDPAVMDGLVKGLKEQGEVLNLEFKELIEERIQLNKELELCFEQQSIPETSKVRP